MADTPETRSSSREESGRSSDSPREHSRPSRSDYGDRDRRQSGPRGGGGGGGRGGPRRRRYPRRKVCQFCVEKAEWVDYKDMRKLRRFVTDRGKILPRRVTGTCARHQRILTMAIKRARHVALLPFKSQ